MAELVMNDLTTGALNGTGAFDILMRTTKAHLEAEYDKGRIKGPEYATVYLGALDNVMANALQFLLQGRQMSLQSDLLAQQIILAQVEVQKAAIQLQLLDIEKQKVNAEVAEITARTALLGQQKINLAAELPKIIAEVAEMGSRAQLTAQQVINMAAELPKIIAEVAEMESRATLTAQQVTNLNAESLNIPKQGELLDAQVCKLQAEFDLTVNTNTKTTGEIALLSQRTATERAQTQALGVDDDSVIGKQKSLYGAQTSGFTRDAEQKVAKTLIDTWSARRMSDEGTVADGVNMLQDSTIGRAVNKLLAGINA